MQLQSIFTLFTLACSALASPRHSHKAPLEARQTPSKPCAHVTGGVHIIAIPGAGSTNPPYGLLNTLRQSLMNAIPGSNNISMPYNHTETNGLKQTGDATNTLHTWIQQYKTSCPNSKIVLIGYSSGAIAALNTVCGESSAYVPAVPALDGATYGPNVIAIVAYGDETRTANQTYDKGTCTGVGIHPRAASSAACGKGWGARVQSYCDKEDPLCCATTGNPNNTAAHYTYPKYDKVATQFVLSQLKAHGGP